MIVTHMGFSENLRKLISDRSLKLTTISTATGIPISTLSEWTAGREPKVSEALIKLCRYLDVSLDNLVLMNNNEIHNPRITTQVVFELDGEKYSLLVQKLRNDGSE